MFVNVSIIWLPGLKNVGQECEGEYTNGDEEGWGVGEK